MAKLVWDQTGQRTYETGVDRGVLFFPNDSGKYVNGVAWNGLTAVNESPSGAESTPLYADNIKYLEIRAAEDFGATIEAFTYPEEFEACDGSASLGQGIKIGQQERVPFGLCYRTILGNDVQANNYGYKLHLIYGATASPSEKNYATVNDSPEAITFSWELTTTPIEVDGFKPTASLTINSVDVKPEVLAAIEALLYGSETSEPTMPTPNEIKAILDEN